jgi:hypothetical protein
MSSRSKGFGGWRRAPGSFSADPPMTPVRGSPVPQSRDIHTRASTVAISGASAVFRGLRPASLPDDDDDAQSRPPQPHRDDSSGSARAER